MRSRPAASTIFFHKSALEIHSTLQDGIYSLRMPFTPTKTVRGAEERPEP